MRTAEQVLIKTRRVWPWVFTICVALMLVTAYGMWMRSARKLVAQSNAGLRVPEELLNFGEVWSDQNFQWRLPIENTTQSDVEVSDIASHCHCSSVDPRAFVVPAGGAVELHVMLDLTAREPGDTATEWHDFSTHLRPILKRGLPNQRGWELRGRVHNAFEISTRRLRFEGTERLVQGTRFPAKTVLLTGHVPLTRVFAQVDSEKGTASVRRREDASAFEVDVAANDGLPAGPFHFDVTIRGTTQGGQSLPGIDVAVSGTVAPDIEAFPRLVQLGKRLRGARSEEMITLRSTSGIGFSVDRVTTDCNGLRVQPAQIASRNAQHGFRLSYDFQEVGEVRGELRFGVRDEIEQYHEVVVAVTGYVTASEEAPEDAVKVEATSGSK